MGFFTPRRTIIDFKKGPWLNSNLISYAVRLRLKQVARCVRQRQYFEARIWAATHLCNPFTTHLSPPHLPRATMSSPSTSRSNFNSIFNTALQGYKKKTGKDINSHPLATELQSCHSPDTVLAVLRRQIPLLDQSQSGEEGFAKSLTPIINVLYAFNATLGDGVGLVIVTMPSG